MNVRPPVIFVLCIGCVIQVSGQQLPVVRVAGQPFTADEVATRDPAPNVRNVIRIQTTRVYRDSEGRTRIEAPAPGGPAYTHFVQIDDPIAGVHYSIDPQTKVIHRLLIPVWNPAQSSNGKKDVAGRFTMFPLKCSYVSHTDSLGTKILDGLAAEGHRVTSEPGSDCASFRATGVTVETWDSPALSITLLMKRSGVMGDETTSLENVHLAEPDPLLFQPPPDYTIVEEPSFSAR